MSFSVSLFSMMSILLHQNRKLSTSFSNDSTLVWDGEIPLLCYPVSQVLDRKYLPLGGISPPYTLNNESLYWSRILTFLTMVFSLLLKNKPVWKISHSWHCMIRSENKKFSLTAFNRHRWECVGNVIKSLKSNNICWLKPKKQLKHQKKELTWLMISLIIWLLLK